MSEAVTPSPVDDRDPEPTTDRGHIVLTVLVVLALGASIAMLFTNSAAVMKVAALAALWAAFLGVFLVARYRRGWAHEKARAREAERAHAAELAHEQELHREQELLMEQNYADALRDQQDRVLAEISAQLAHMRSTLESLTGQAWTFEPPDVRVEARRRSELLRAQATDDEVVDADTAADDAADPASPASEPATVTPPVTPPVDVATAAAKARDDVAAAERRRKEMEALRARREAEQKAKAAAEAEAKKKAAAEAEAKRKAEAEAEAKRKAEAEAKDTKGKAAADGTESIAQNATMPPTSALLTEDNTAVPPGKHSSLHQKSGDANTLASSVQEVGAAASTGHHRRRGSSDATTASGSHFDTGTFAAVDWNQGGATEDTTTGGRRRAKDSAAGESAGGRRRRRDDNDPAGHHRHGEGEQKLTVAELLERARQNKED